MYSIENNKTVSGQIFYHLKKWLVIIFLLNFSYINAQGYTREELKASYIYNFLKYVEWEDHKPWDKIRIGILGSDPEMRKELVKMVSTEKMNGLSMEILDFKSDSEIKDVQLLYVSENLNFSLKRINKQIKNKQILLITDRSNKKDYVMINFIDTKTGKLKFEINRDNLLNNKLNFSEEILVFGGTEIDIVTQFKDYKKEIEEQRKMLAQQETKIKQNAEELEAFRESIEEQEIKIKEQDNAIVQQETNIKGQNNIIRQQEGRLEEANVKLANTIKETAQSVKELDNISKKNEILSVKLNDNEKLIKEQLLKFNQNNEALKDLDNKIIEGVKTIKNQKKELANQKGKIKSQKSVIYLTGITLSLTLILIGIVLYSYVIKRRHNKLLTEKNTLLYKKQEEIEAKNIELINQKEKIEEAYTQIKNVKLKLLNSEKMATLGVMTAGIAHEINNPLTFIAGGVYSLNENYTDFIKLIEYYETIPLKQEEQVKLEELKQGLNINNLIKDTPLLFKDVNMGIDRTKEIVKGLSTFSRQENGDKKFVNIHEILDSTLILMLNKYKNRIEIELNYDEKAPKITCYPSKINQVFVNIISNAIDAIDAIDASGAIEKEGKIIISTYDSKDNINISIKDNGTGIPDDIIDHIFEPFFTTKDVGTGTGLGLSISYNIIHEHNGSIDVKSDFGKGTEFIIKLPKLGSVTSNNIKS